MKVILQLSLIVILWNYRTTGKFIDERCLKLRNLDLYIPQNVVASGWNQMTRDTWYQHVFWYDSPAGDLILTYRIEYLDNEQWIPFSYGKLNILEKGKDEAHDVAYLARKLLGMNYCIGKIPGKARVPATIFLSGKCTTIRFKSNFRENCTYRLYLDAEDDDSNRILTGHVKMIE